MKLLDKIFGTYSEREIKKVMPLVDKIIALEEDMKKLSNDELRAKTDEFVKRVENGESLDSLLVEAYAVVSEAVVRVYDKHFFKVQLIGGIILHQGRIAEMKTGEGKTLTAALPLYLNALTKKGVHLVTVNDYLAKTQGILMGKLYKFLGLSVGIIVNGMSPKEKQEAYNSDIVYGTNNEFGFDYLRDNMTMQKENMVQRQLNYAIVDEIDSILIDEARTPLIISGMVNKKSDIYEKANAFARTLKAKTIVESDDKNFDEADEEYDYIIDLKAKSVALTEKGTKKAEKYFGIECLSDVDNLAISHHVNQAIRAYGIMHRDKDYIVRDGEVIIVDEFTGRAMEGRRYSDGLHQAIEAKEGVKIAFESQTLATITFQNYFRLYSKLAGMTGTAKTEEEEFKGIYKLDVVEIPTNMPVIRQDYNDVVYKTQNGKFNAIVEDIKESYEKGQPVLVGTISIDKSEKLSMLLKKAGIPHQVLNAKYHEKEAEIIAQAGKYKAVTIATNMAGRGTDIMLGGNLEYLVKSDLAKLGYTKEVIEMALTPIEYDIPEVKEAKEKVPGIENKYKAEIEEGRKKVIEAGGLKIIGSERHESRRIDNQLRGRSGRQGDIGSSRFYISFEDDLMKLFGSERINALADTLGFPEDTPIQMGVLTSTIENAQKKIEGINYSRRKSVLEYDDVMNKQRNIIYDERRKVLDSENVKDIIMPMVRSKIEDIVYSQISSDSNASNFDFETLNTLLSSVFGDIAKIDASELDTFDEERIIDVLYSKVLDTYEAKHNKAKEMNTEEFLNNAEKYLILNVVNEKWMDHIDDISQLKDGIGLRAYGQTNPLDAYKRESFDMFEEMIGSIKTDSIRAVFSIKEVKEGENVKTDTPRITSLSSAGEPGSSKVTNVRTNQEVKREPVRVEKKVGRNELCPCRFRLEI
ncbi:MAG: preprotein translocase subunit SecA [Clostridia bacterium]|nr:preprotein translocase subunit SecA [Clostridia bacterium]